MMLALLIGTMILTASASVFVSTMDGWRRGSRVYSQLQAADKIGGLIEKHLRAALDPATDKQAVFVGEDLSTDDSHAGHRLTLISSAPGRFPRNLPEADECEIAFEYDPSGTAGMTMRIQCPPDGTPDDGGYLIGLSNLIVGFRVIYYDGKKWQESWSDSSLPQAVEFTLLFNRSPDDNAATPASAASSSGSSATAPSTSGGQGSSGAGAAAGEGPIEVTRLIWLPMGKASSDESAAQSNGQGTDQNGNQSGNQNGQSGNGGQQGGDQNGAGASTNAGGGR